MHIGIASHGNKQSQWSGWIPVTIIVGQDAIPDFEEGMHEN